MKKLFKTLDSVFNREERKEIKELTGKKVMYIYLGSSCITSDKGYASVPKELREATNRVSKFDTNKTYNIISIEESKALRDAIQSSAPKNVTRKSTKNRQGQDIEYIASNEIGFHISGYHNDVMVANLPVKLYYWESTTLKKLQEQLKDMTTKINGMNQDEWVFIMKSPFIKDKKQRVEEILEHHIGSRDNFYILHQPAEHEEVFNSELLDLFNSWK